MRILFFFLAMLALQGAPVIAQEASQDEPVEITADTSLEWNRNKKTFIARDNALAVQGDVSLSADIITAHYKEGAESDIEIYKVIAEGKVVITSKDTKAFSDKAEYDLESGKAILTGDNLKMQSPDQTVTARDNFEYFVARGELVANGNVVVTRPRRDGSGELSPDKMFADVMRAYLKENDQGERVLDRLEAESNVKIQTQAEVITGNYGLYEADKNEAFMQGNIVITRGPNILKGDKATVDLNTSVSKLIGTSDNRVSGVFYPGSAP